MKNQTATPSTPQQLIVRQPVTPENLTAILRWMMEAAERGEPCPIVVENKA